MIVRSLADNSHRWPGGRPRHFCPWRAGNGWSADASVEKSLCQYYLQRRRTVS